MRWELEAEVTAGHIWALCHPADLKAKPNYQNALPGMQARKRPWELGDLVSGRTGAWIPICLASVSSLFPWGNMGDSYESALVTEDPPLSLKPTVRTVMLFIQRKSREFIWIPVQDKATMQLIIPGLQSQKNPALLCDLGSAP